VVQRNDGTFVFDSYWNDSVIIKTFAHVGDSWVFYKDTSSLYYKASVISLDTMTVLSSVDSIKRILITAHNATGIVTSDPVDSFQIILSKNNGFVQVFDLYTFPYHMPDSTFTAGLDFYLDRSLLSQKWVDYFPTAGPDQNNSIFHLVDFLCPTDRELYNWNLGDVVESVVTMYQGLPGFSSFRMVDTISSKVVLGDTVIYTQSGSYNDCLFYCLSTISPCPLINNAGVYSYSDSSFSIINPSQTPEETGFNYYIFYFPNDTSFCSTNAAYGKVKNDYHTFAYGLERAVYKLGIGKTHTEYWDEYGINPMVDLMYYNIRGTSCGIYTPPPSSVRNVKLAAHSYELYPNPATNELTIKSANNQSYTLTIYNPVGQAMRTFAGIRQTERLDVSNIPRGIYNIAIIGSNGERVNEKLVILH
jgi:hypothetical protein